MAEREKHNWQRCCRVLSLLFGRLFWVGKQKDEDLGKNIYDLPAHLLRVLELRIMARFQDL
jgi:hypothetical protein